MKHAGWNFLAVHKMVLVVAVGAVLLGASGLERTVPREVSSVRFPKYALMTDVEDVLKDYPAYLRFVLTVGRQVNPAAAARLEKNYLALRKRDAVAAARFLRGLRFEMVQKLEFIGASPDSVSSETPLMRRWVAKFLPAWSREADEYNFRAFTSHLARRE